MCPTQDSTSPSGQYFILHGNAAGPLAINQTTSKMKQAVTPMAGRQGAMTPMTRGRGAMNSKNSGSSDVDREISRLAKLGMVEYERERKDAAARLNVRASILDRLVAAERDKLTMVEAGSRSELARTGALARPVNGASA